MIRRKKTEDEINLAPLEEDGDITGSDESFDDSTLDDGNSSTEKGFSLKFPWKKAKAVKEESDADSLEMESEEDNFDPLNLAEDGVEYEKIEDEKKFSKKKIIAIVGGVLLVLAVGIFFLVKNINSGDSGKAYVQSVAVLAGLGSADGTNNRYTGEVEPQESWKISLDGDMSVEKCYVKVGDEVKKGDKLFTYNTEELKLNKEKKELEVETMENENNQLTKDITSYEADLKSASSSEKIELQTQILTAQTTIKKNTFSIKSGKEEIEKIKKNIAQATVSSKMDGVIKSINKSVGAGSSDNNDDMNTDDGTGEDAGVYMTILATGDYRVKGKLSETNIHDLEEGDRVIVRSRVDDNTWTGLIASIKTDDTASDGDSSAKDAFFDDESSSMEGASSYYFFVEMDGTDGLLMGQHVFVEQDNGQDSDKEGIWISSAFVCVEEDDCYVWADNGKEHLEKRKVEIGEYDEILDQYQITKGIDSSDYIAANDIDMRAGMKTTKVDPYSEDQEEFEDQGDGFEGGMSDDFEDGMDDDFSFDNDAMVDGGDMGDDMNEEIGAFEMKQ